MLGGRLGTMLFSRWGAAVAASVAFLALMAWTHHGAYERGRLDERAAALERSVEILRERTMTDETIRNMGDADLCRALGGEWVPDDDACR